MTAAWITLIISIIVSTGGLALAMNPRVVDTTRIKLLGLSTVALVAGIIAHRMIG
jgi:hypothetical protein